MHEVIPFVTHRPPETSITLSEEHIKYIVHAATLITRYRDTVDFPDAPLFSGSQIDILILEACSLLIIDSIILPSTLTPDGLTIVEHARGLAKVASGLIEAGMNDFDIMDVMHDKWSESHCKDFLRACRTIHAYFKEG